jgi:hypothetical protein
MVSDGGLARCGHDQSERAFPCPLELGSTEMDLNGQSRGNQREVLVRLDYPLLDFLGGL